jgi:dihydrofolate reductase
MRISIVVAVSENGVIGRDGTIPWRLPDDQKLFKQITLNHCIVMGRRTHESIGRLLPGRTSLIVSRNPDYRVPGARVIHDLEEAIEAGCAAGEEEIFIIGGAGLYEAAWPRADRLYLTRVRARVEGEIRLPDHLEPEANGFVLIGREEHSADPRHAHAFSFQIWQRESAT